jgi:RecA-family ATPase
MKRVDNDKLILLKHLDFIGVRPPNKWIIKDLLPKGEDAGIVGHRGIGKSTIVTQLGLSVASGKKFLGLPIIEQMPVLMVSTEDDKAKLGRRIHNIKFAPEYELGDIENVPFYTWSRAGKDSILGYQKGSRVKLGSFIKSLKDKIIEVGQGRDILLILDNVNDMFEINEYDQQIIDSCVKSILGGLIEENNCTLLLVVETHKNEKIKS